MTTPKSNDPRRSKQIAAIHAAKRDLGMDEDTYRQMLEQITGQRSAAGLTSQQRHAVLDHLKKSGAKLNPKKRVAQHPQTPHTLDTKPLLQKIEALLADMKLPWAYAHAIGKQQTGIQKLEWIRRPEDLQAVVAALTVEQEKRDLHTGVLKRLELIGRDLDWLEQTLGLKKGWNRNRKTLHAIINRLDLNYPQELMQ
jgi:phage gp16-like protein